MWHWQSINSSSMHRRAWGMRHALWWRPQQQGRRGRKLVCNIYCVCAWVRLCLAVAKVKNMAWVKEVSLPAPTQTETGYVRRMSGFKLQHRWISSRPWQPIFSMSLLRVSHESWTVQEHKIFSQIGNNIDFCICFRCSLLTSLSGSKIVMNCMCMQQSGFSILIKLQTVVGLFAFVARLLSLKCDQIWFSRALMTALLSDRLADSLVCWLAVHC